MVDDSLATDEFFPQNAGVSAEVVAEANRRSTRNAVLYFLLTPVVVLGTAGVIALISRLNGGPFCDAGQATWLCTRTSQILFSLIPGIISLGALFGSAWFTYRAWARQERWRWWIAGLWLSMPFVLAWITGTASLLMNGA